MQMTLVAIFSLVLAGGIAYLFLTNKAAKEKAAKEKAAATTEQSSLGTLISWGLLLPAYIYCCITLLSYTTHGSLLQMMFGAFFTLFQIGRL